MGLVLGTGCFLAAGRFWLRDISWLRGASGCGISPDSGHLLAGALPGSGMFRFYFPVYFRRFISVFLRLIAEQITLISAFLNELMPLIPRLLAISLVLKRQGLQFSRIVFLLIKFNSSPAKSRCTPSVYI